jgi:hypothetical protein
MLSKSILSSVALATLTVSALSAQRIRHDRLLLRPDKGESVRIEKFEGAPFMSLECAPVATLVAVMRDDTYYYAEVEVSNRGAESVTLSDRFLQVEKADAIFRQVSVQLVAADLARSANIPFKPAPPPPTARQTTTTSQATVIYTPSGAMVSETRNTAPSQEAQAAALGNAIGNIFAAIEHNRQQKAAKKFVAFLAATDEAYQSRELKAGESRRMIFAFTKLSKSKAPIVVTMRQGDCVQAFRLKD